MGLKEDLERVCRESASFGKPLHFYAEIPSTNDAAMELAEKGAHEGALVVADKQTAGRGRMGRKWASPEGLNLYFSIVLRPEKPLMETTCLSLVFGIGLAKAIEKLDDKLHPKVKWPNDIYLEGKKACGILMETKANGNIAESVILGIGLNVNVRANDLPAELSSKATSLIAALGKNIDRSHLLELALTELETAYNQWKDKGFIPFIQDWKKRSLLLGRRIAIENRHETIHGTVIDLARSGALILETETGQLQQIVSGDVL